MAKVFDLPAGTIVPQPDFEAREDGNSGWTATQTFYVLRGQVDNPAVRQRFNKGTPITDLYPEVDQVYRYLRVTRIAGSAIVPGGYTAIRVEFTGTSFWNPYTNNTEDFPLGDPEVTYHLRGSLTTAPLTEHPKYKALSSLEQAALGDLAKGTLSYLPTDVPALSLTAGMHYTDPDLNYTRAPDFLQVTSDNGIEFAKRIQSGRDSYDVSTLTWTKRYTSTVSLTSSQIALLGKITTPPGNPSDPTGQNRTWRFENVEQDQQGIVDPVYHININFQLSDTNGWDEFLYTD